MTADFEQMGYATVRETRDLERAKQICTLLIQALKDELQPPIAAATACIEESGHRMRALCAQLYEGEHPVRDAEMLARSRLCLALAILLAIVVVASVSTQTVTFMWMGQSMLIGLGIGAVLTGVATAAGHVAVEGAIRRQPAKACLGGVVWLAVLVGLWQIGEARGLVAGAMVAPSTAQDASSFVDGDTDAGLTESGSAGGTLQERVSTLLGSATAKIMIAADAVSGLFLAMLVSLATDATFTAWRHLHHLKVESAKARHERDRLSARPERAWKQALAGIMRGAHYAQRRTITPYFTLVAAVVVSLATARPAFSQGEITRHRVIVIDTSGSIGANTGDHLFRDYLHAVRALLAQTPPNTRVWVEAITTDSFGGMEPLLRGRTPGANGVFTDGIAQARRQLVSTFETRAAQLTPAASGTDLFGALAHAKAAAESVDATGGRPIASELVVLSDMVNETGSFQMPALVARGPDPMLRLARAQRLIVPLTGWNVRVMGASTTGLTPQAWNVIREFWHQYFAAAGARLDQYSADVIIE